MRGAKRKGVRYFGPYSHAWAIRETLDLLLRVFPARTCSAGVFKRHRPDRPAVPARRHRQVLGAVRRPGRRRRAPADRRGLLRLHGRPHRHAWSAASSGRCRRPPTSWSSSGRPGCATTSPRCAGRWRSRPSCFGDGTDADVVAFAEDQLEAAVQVFHVRGGRVRGQRGWVVEKTEELSTGDLVHHFCTQVYGGEAEAASGRPAPRGAGAGAARPTPTRWPSGSAELRGSRVSLRVPQRGDKRALHGDRRPQRRRGADPAQAAPGRRPHRPQPGAGGDRRRARAGRRRRCGSSATTSRRSRAPTWWRAWSSSRTAWPARASTAGSSSPAPPTTCRPSPRCCAAGSPATSARERDRRARPTTDRPADRPDDRAAAQVRVPAAAGRGRRRRAAGQRGRGGAAPTWASPTSRCAGWPSGWRRCGCPTSAFPVILPRTSRGALPAAAGPRRGAPVRDHVPPPAAVEADDASALDGVPGLGEIRRKALLRRFGSVKRLGRGERRGDRRGARASAGAPPRRSWPRCAPGRARRRRRPAGHERCG